MAGKIPIHWLHSHAYCEYQIYLEKVKGIEPEITVEVQQGMEAHTALDESHKAAAELELTVSDALAKAIEEGIELVAREVLVEGTNLIGSIDEVLFTPNQVLIVDDKPGDVAYLTSKRQLWGYCLAFEEQYTPKLPIIAVLRNRDTGKEIWSEPFSQEHREETQYVIDRIMGMLAGEIVQVQATDNPNKCRRCGLRTSCDAKVE